MRQSDEPAVILYGWEDLLPDDPLLQVSRDLLAERGVRLPVHATPWDIARALLGCGSDGKGLSEALNGTPEGARLLYGVHDPAFVYAQLHRARNMFGVPRNFDAETARGGLLLRPDDVAFVVSWHEMWWRFWVGWSAGLSEDLQPSVETLARPIPVYVPGYPSTGTLGDVLLLSGGSVAVADRRSAQSPVPGHLGWFRRDKWALVGRVIPPGGLDYPEWVTRVNAEALERGIVLPPKPEGWQAFSSKVGVRRSNPGHPCFGYRYTGRLPSWREG